MGIFNLFSNDDDNSKKDSIIDLLMLDSFEKEELEKGNFTEDSFSEEELEDDDYYEIDDLEYEDDTDD